MAELGAHDDGVHQISFDIDPDVLDAILDDPRIVWGPSVPLDITSVCPPTAKAVTAPPPPKNSARKAKERALRKKILSVFARNEEYTRNNRTMRLEDIITAIAHNPHWYRIVKPIADGDSARMPELIRLMHTSPLEDLCHSYYLYLENDFAAALEREYPQDFPR